MNAKEQAAWLLYCSMSAGAESARDFWEELSQKDQEYYLSLVEDTP